jgi:hypothetical protein
MTLVGLIFASSIMNNGENLPFEELKSYLVQLLGVLLILHMLLSYRVQLH